MSGVLKLFNNSKVLCGLGDLCGECLVAALPRREFAGQRGKVLKGHLSVGGPFPALMIIWTWPGGFQRRQAAPRRGHVNRRQVGRAESRNRDPCRCWFLHRCH